MARKLDPGMTAVLTAGAAGAGLAIASGVAMWLIATGLGVSYEIEGAEPVGIGHVVSNLAVVALAATALALVLRGTTKAVLFFLLSCFVALGISLLTPITLAVDFPTAAVLVGHHVLGGAFIGFPLTRSLGNQ